MEYEYYFRIQDPKRTSKFGIGIVIGFFDSLTREFFQDWLFWHRDCNFHMRYSNRIPTLIVNLKIQINFFVSQRYANRGVRRKNCSVYIIRGFNLKIVLSESWATGRFLRCIVWGDPHVIQFDGSFVDILAKRQTYKLIEYRTVTEEQLKVEYSISVTTNSKWPAQCQEKW